MTAPHTKVSILHTGTALLFNSLRDTHTSADSVHTDNVFVYDTHAQVQILRARTFVRLLVWATHTTVHIVCTGKALVFTSLRDCMRV